MNATNNVSRPSVSHTSFTPAVVGTPKSETPRTAPAARQPLTFKDGFEARSTRAAQLISSPTVASLDNRSSVTQLVSDAYRTHLRREPDAGGLSNWSAAAEGLAAQGKSQQEISAWLGEQLGSSMEGQALRVTDEVFQEVLGRDVSGGRGFWHDAAARMVGEGQSIDQVRDTLRTQFMNSEEYQLNHPEQVVAQQYRELLGREPDGEGLANYVGLANQMRAEGKGLGEIREAIANSIRSSAEYKNRTGGVSLQQLQSIMPHLSTARAQQMLPHLNAAMQEAGINTPRRQAAFLAQLAHESGEFQFMEELATGEAYEGRLDLGNTEPGDGPRFKGRGPIQLTGRSNYRAAGQALGIDLENNPRRAADPDVGFRTAAWFWNSRNLNSFADAGNFDAITLRVNGGFNGKASRDAYYARAMQVLGG